ncbi:Hsp70-Hsp90 organizing protein [Acrasis kona]|uniref:Hsp70-Hsp90 organizing protein n=1 Tax=Acrasis kona TaxID=1008807 RepID=A0AAW2YMP6_9EUKA
MEIDHEQEVKKKFSARYKTIAKQAFSQGLFDNALKLYEISIKCFPIDPVLYSNCCACLLKLRRYEEAKKAAEMCINLDDGNVRGHRGLGQSLLMLGKYEDAISSFNNSKRLLPENIYSLHEPLDASINICKQSLVEIGQIRINFLLIIPNEVINYILEYLDATSLLRCIEVCSTLHTFANKETLFEPLCHLQWKGKLKTKHTIPFELDHTWKNTFFECQKYSKRDLICDEDLCMFKWRFESAVPLHNYSGDLLFHANHSYDAHIDHYGWFDSRGTCWTIIDGGRGLQIANRPRYHSIQRKDDWGWKMFNGEVVLQTVSVQEMED